MKQFIYEFMNNSSTFVGTVIFSVMIVLMILAICKLNKIMKDDR